MDEPVMKRDILTPTIVFIGVLIVILFLWAVMANAQTHTMPGSNVVPSGASLTIQSGGSITAAAGSTVTGFGAGTPGGSNTQVQYNNSGAFGGISGVTSNGASLTGRINPRVTSIASNATWSPSATTDDIYEITAQTVAVTTISNPTGTPVDGQSLIIRFCDNGTPRALTWSGTQWEAGPGVTLPTTTVASRHDYAAFKWNSTTSKWTMLASSQDAAVLNAGTGFTVGGVEFPTSANGIVKRTAANTYSAAIAGTDYAAPDSPLQWDGGSTNLVAATGRTSLGGTTVGQSFFTLTNPGAITFPEISATNVVSTKTAAQLKTDLSLTATDVGLGSVTNNAQTQAAIVPNTAPATGKILIGNGSSYSLSTPTWPTAAGAAGYQVRSDATNFASYPTQLSNASTTNLTTSTADIYLAGSSIVLTAGDFKAKGQYHCVFDMAKTAGTGAIVVSVRVGTAGTTSDTAVLTFTFGAGTGVADSGVFEVWAAFRTVGSGTSAVMVGGCQVNHQLSTTGLINNAATWPIIGVVSSGFNSSTATTIGCSFNGATAFAGTNTMVQATLEQ